MSTQKREWTYFDEQAGDWIRPLLTLEELDAKYAEGVIEGRGKGTQLELGELGAENRAQVSKDARI